MKKRSVFLMGLAAAAGAGYVYWRQQQAYPEQIVEDRNGRKILRTPEERFENLSDYPFAPNYKIVDGLRVHYVDEGPAEGEVVLLLHGEPSWSYLYRKMIPVFAKAGHRAVAPDLIGFGKSDKLTEPGDYTYQRHIDWMWDWLQQADLQNITLFCQDWGALIGLRLVAAHPERFARVVVANGTLPTGHMNQAFKAWLTFSQKVPIFPVGIILQGATTTFLPKAVINAYKAPFPSEKYKAGARVFPLLVPSYPEHPEAEVNKEAWEALRTFDKPFLTAFGDGDPIMRGADKKFQEQVPGAQGQPHTIVPGAGHFLQEDKGEELARITLEFMAANKSS